MYRAMVLTALFLASPARAQSEQDLLITSTTTLYVAAALVPVTTTVGVIVALVMMSGADDDPGKMDDDKGFDEDFRVRALELYLRHNAMQLAQDLATGHGPTVVELAAALELSPQGARTLTELMRSDRDALLELADVEKLDTRRAAAFARRLHRLLMSEAKLRTEVERFARKAGADA